MPEADRVVEIIGTNEGSGYLIGPRLVLTAWHVVCPKENETAPQTVQIRILRDYRAAKGVDKYATRSARLIWPLSEPGEDYDFALLAIADDTGPNDDPVSWVDLAAWGEVKAQALGFPDLAIFKNRELEEIGYAAFDERDTHWVSGLISPGSGLKTRAAWGQGTFEIPMGADASSHVSAINWKGMSGATVFAGPDLIGVVQTASDAGSLRQLKALPVERLFRRDDVVEAIRREGLLVPPQRTILPAYAIVGAEAFAASSRTLNATAAKPFYGRDEDLRVLDAGLTAHDRGVLLVRGEAGLGKSRLAVRWTGRWAGARHTTVLQHAFSVREPLAGTRAAMAANFVRQAALALGPEALGEGDPTARLEDRVATLLSTDRPEHSRLIVLIDALDEAAELIEPWSAGLGRGVYLLATMRAEPNDEPRVLRLWRERAVESGTLVADHTLGPLDTAAIASWLTVALGRDVAEDDPFVDRATKASEGVPLFASYLIPDAIEALRANAGDPFPSSFTEYARQHLTDLQDRLAQTSTGRWSWGHVLDLFGLLSVAKAPLSPMALQQLLEARRLDELDQRVERWLWRRAETGGDVSFAHPRLKAVFGAVLPQFEMDVATVEERLIEVCSKAWSGAGRHPLKLYALSWLPAHFVGQGRLQEAAALLGDGAFLLARLAASPTAAMTRFTAMETIELNVRLAGGEPALADWHRFWAETEAPLVAAIERGLEATRALAQLAHDRFGRDSPSFRRLAFSQSKHSFLGMRLERPCGFDHPTLLRSLEGAHRGYVGVLALTDGLVSWGSDGAIRFWSYTGEPRPGGDSHAHEFVVRGVLPLSDQLVSWGSDGAIRFWSHTGESRANIPEAHEVPVEGVLALADGLVSWDDDGAICFWSSAGEPRPGGDPEAHEGSVGGVLALADGW